jgi:hypothetical protein
MKLAWVLALNNPSSSVLKKFCLNLFYRPRLRIDKLGDISCSVGCRKMFQKNRRCAASIFINMGQE